MKINSKMRQGQTLSICISKLAKTRCS